MNPYFVCDFLYRKEPNHENGSTNKKDSGESARQSCRYSQAQSNWMDSNELEFNQTVPQTPDTARTISARTIYDARNVDWLQSLNNFSSMCHIVYL